LRPAHSAGGTGRDEAALVRVDHRLHTVAEAELLEDARDVRLRGRVTDEEPLADLAVGQPADEQVQDLVLPGGQLGHRRRGRGGRGRRLACELRDHRARDGRGEQGLAAGDDPDGGGDLLGRSVLEHEAARAGAKGVVDVRVETERRQDQHPRAGLRAHDAPGRLDPVEHGHPNVHQHHVRT
jgi:hypothetical protein